MAFGVAPPPAEHPEVKRIAAEAGARPSQVALSWLLHHAPHVLFIPGISSLAHLEENLGAADVAPTPEQVAALGGLAAG